MKKIISALLCILIIGSALMSCSNVAVNEVRGEEKAYSISSSASAEKYASLLEEISGGNLKGRYIIGDESDASLYDISLDKFAEDGYIIRSIGDETLIFGKTDKGLDRAVRYYSNYCFDTKTDVNVIYGEGPKVKSLTIAGNDISEYSIYLFEGADECHTYAAEVLRDYIGRACGFYPEIVNQKPSGHMISFVQELSGKHGDEAFTIAVKDGNLIITGGRFRGCMYGVFEFLETYVGWRFLYDNEFTSAGLHSYYNTYKDAIIDYLYESEHVDIAEGTVDYQEPSFNFRQVSVRGAYMSNMEDYDIKRKVNGIKWRKSSYSNLYSKFNAYGVTVAADHGVQYELKDRLYDEFGVDVNNHQPCYTDEKFISLAEEVFGGKVEKRIANGERLGLEITTIDVAMCDNANFCSCKECRKYIKLDKAGNTGPVLYFTNRMADAFAEKYPELKVTMLVYLDAKRPPAVTVPSENVQISYCFYFSSHSQVPCSHHCISGEYCEKGKISNIIESEYFEKWCEITDDIVVWYYPGTWYFTGMPSSYIYTMLEDIRYLKDNGKIEGIYSCPSYSLYGDGIVAYLLRHLLWDCGITDEEYENLIREYCNIMYGSGGEYIYRFLQFKENANQDGCWSNMNFSGPNQRIKFDKYGENADYVIELFNSAMKYADTELQKVRVETLSMSAYFIISIALYEKEYVSGTYAQRTKYAERWEAFLENVRKYGFGYDVYYSDGTMPEFPFDKADLSVNPGSIVPFHHSEGWWNEV